VEQPAQRADLEVTLLLGKGSAARFIADVLLGLVRFAMIVLKVPHHGSILGFLGISVRCAVDASTFGLAVAAARQLSRHRARGVPPRDDAGGA